MQYNFIVSDYRKLWIEGAPCLYLVEPYVYYSLERSGNISDYHDIVVAPYRRASRTDLEADHNFIQIKFEKYITVLTARLNQIHGTSYTALFWRRALSLSFERYLVFLYEMFQNCELYFNRDKHDCFVLSKQSYHVPLMFEDQRIFFQHSDYGQEQLFSIYMHTFYPEELKAKDAEFVEKYRGEPKKAEKSLFVRLLNQDISKATFDKVKTKVLNKYYSFKTHKVGLLGTFFSPEYLDLLIKKSRGGVFPLVFCPDPAGFCDTPLLNDTRKALAETQPDSDKFDLFFFASLECCLPRSFVEDFKKIEAYCLEHFLKYEDLKFVVSEAWLASNILSIALALLKERGVRHIYNEHNYFEHPWVGSLIPKEASLSDIFVSLGWKSDKIPGMVRGASLRGFKSSEIPEKRYKITFVGSGALAKRPSYTASYGWVCENAPKHIQFCKMFFAGLSNTTKSEMFYRGYPLASYDDWLGYDPDFVLAPYLAQIRKHNDITMSGMSVMLQSDLVIIDYISTSYLEALLMNIPTIFFWNPEAYYLSPESADFFEPLVSVGICQTDPVEAVRFVEHVKDNPEKWWGLENVQKAKNDFLNRNLGKPEAMIDFLVGLAGK